MDLKPQLLDYFHDKSMLLILDNLEHLLNGVRWLSKILAAAAQLTHRPKSSSELTIEVENVSSLYPTDTVFPP